MRKNGIHTTFWSAKSVQNHIYRYLDNKIMKARFDGKCKSCGDDIRKGKEIARNADEVWVHKHCVEELVDLP